MYRLGSMLMLTWYTWAARQKVAKIAEESTTWYTKVPFPSNNARGSYNNVSAPYKIGDTSSHTNLYGRRPFVSRFLASEFLRTEI